VVALKRAVGCGGVCAHSLETSGSSSLAADTSSQLDVLGHDGDTLGVNGAQIRVLKQTHEVGLARLLQRHHRGTLESQVGLEILCDFTDETLKRQLANEQLGGLLVATDLTQRHSSGPVTMRFLHTTGGWSAFPRRLGRQLFSRRLSTGRFTGCLLGSGHGEKTNKLKTKRQKMN